MLTRKRHKMRIFDKGVPPMSMYMSMQKCLTLGDGVNRTSVNTNPNRMKQKIQSSSGRTVEVGDPGTKHTYAVHRTRGVDHRQSKARGPRLSHRLLQQTPVQRRLSAIFWQQQTTFCCGEVIFVWYGTAVPAATGRARVWEAETARCC